MSKSNEDQERLYRTIMDEANDVLLKIEHMIVDVFVLEAEHLYEPLRVAYLAAQQLYNEADEANVVLIHERTVTLKKK